MKQIKKMLVFTLVFAYATPLFSAPIKRTHFEFSLKGNRPYWIELNNVVRFGEDLRSWGKTKEKKITTTTKETNTTKQIIRVRIEPGLNNIYQQYDIKLINSENPPLTLKIYKDSNGVMGPLVSVYTITPPPNVNESTLKDITVYLAYRPSGTKLTLKDSTGKKVSSTFYLYPQKGKWGGWGDLTQTGKSIKNNLKIDYIRRKRKIDYMSNAK